MGVILDLDERSLRFSLNGDEIGPAFTRFEFVRGVFPAVSLNQGQSVQFNFGGPNRSLLHKPAGFRPVHAAFASAWDEARAGEEEAARSGGGDAELDASSSMKLSARRLPEDCLEEERGCSMSFVDPAWNVRLRLSHEHRTAKRKQRRQQHERQQQQRHVELSARSAAAAEGAEGEGAGDGAALSAAQELQVRWYAKQLVWLLSRRFTQVVAASTPLVGALSTAVSAQPTKVAASRVAASRGPSGGSDLSLAKLPPLAAPLCATARELVTLIKLTSETESWEPALWRLLLAALDSASASAGDGAEDGAALDELIEGIVACIGDDVRLAASRKYAQVCWRAAGSGEYNGDRRRESMLEEGIVAADGSTEGGGARSRSNSVQASPQAPKGADARTSPARLRAASVAEADAGAWTAAETLAHPHVSLMAYLTEQLLHAAAVVRARVRARRNAAESMPASESRPERELLFRLFEVWCPGLRSPSVLLKEIAAQVLNRLLTGTLEAEQQLRGGALSGPSPSTSGGQGEAGGYLARCLKSVPAERVIAMTSKRLWLEREVAPLYSTYMQHMLSLSSTLALASSCSGGDSFGMLRGVRASASARAAESAVDSANASDDATVERIFSGVCYVGKTQMDARDATNDDDGDDDDDDEEDDDEDENGVMGVIRRRMEARRRTLLRCAPRASASESGGDVPQWRGFLIRVAHNIESGVMSGTVEWPDYRSTVCVEGRCESESGALVLRETRISEGPQEVGWASRFGTTSDVSDAWRPGTEIRGTLDLAKALHRSSFTGSLYVPDVSGSGSGSGASPRGAGRARPGRSPGATRPAGLAIVLDDAPDAAGGDAAAAATTSIGLVDATEEVLFKWDATQTARGAIRVDDGGESVTALRGGSERVTYGTVGFSGGVHYWEIELVEAEPPPGGGIMIGVAEKKTNGRHYWPGWGLVNSRVVHTSGHELPYGEFLSKGDTVGVLLDMDAGRLSFFLDGYKFGERVVKDMGVAFPNPRLQDNSLRGSGAGKRGRVLFPCVGFRTGGGKVRLLRKWSSIAAVPAAEDARRCAELKLLLHRWSNGGMGERGNIPKWFQEESLAEFRRMREGPRLQQHRIRPGRRLEWFDCSRAAIAAVCAQNPALEGIESGDVVAHRLHAASSGGGEPVDERIEIVGARRGMLWGRRTQGGDAWYWLPGEIGDLSIVQRSASSPRSGSGGGRPAAFAPSSPRDDDDEEESADILALAVADVLALDGDDAAEDEVADEESALERFVSRCCNAPPESRSGHVSSALSPVIPPSSLSAAAATWARWTLRADAAVIQLLNRCSAANGVDPLNLDWDAFRREVAHYASTSFAEPSAAPLSAGGDGSLSALRGMRASRILARAAMLLALNRLAGQALPFIPLGSPGLAPPAQILSGLFADELSAVALGTRTMSDNVRDWHVVELRDLLLTSTKQVYWASVLVATAAETSCPAEEWEDPREIKEIRVNRIAARTDRLATLCPEERLRWSMLGQLRDEIESLSAGLKNSTRTLRHECVCVRVCARARSRSR